MNYFYIFGVMALLFLALLFLKFLFLCFETKFDKEKIKYGLKAYAVFGLKVYAFGAAMMFLFCLGGD